MGQASGLVSPFWGLGEGKAWWKSQGQRDGSESRHCHQTCSTEFNLQNLHGGRRETTPASFSLSPHVPWRPQCIYWVYLHGGRITYRNVGDPEIAIPLKIPTQTWGHTSHSFVDGIPAPSQLTIYDLSLPLQRPHAAWRELTAAGRWVQREGLMTNRPNLMGEGDR